MAWLSVVLVVLAVWAWLVWSAWDYRATRAAVLRALRVGPASRRALRRDIPRWSLYNVLSDLEASGLVECGGDTDTGDVWFALRRRGSQA